MKIDIKSQHSLYVHIGDWTFYIDNSTNEQIVEKWKDKSDASAHKRIDALWDAVEQLRQM